jgi:hypothetical protein
MSDSVIATTEKPIPCGVYKAGRDDICGNPATVIILDPLPGRVPLINRWAGLPMCRQCVQETMDVYAQPEQVAWMTLADVAEMAHQQQPEKFSVDRNYEVMRLRRIVSRRKDWQEKGFVKKTEDGLWMVLASVIQQYLDETKGMWIRK